MNYAKKKKIIKFPDVGVLTLMRHPALDEIYRGFRDELKEEGYVNGKNIKIDYQNAIMIRVIYVRWQQS